MAKRKSITIMIGRGKKSKAERMITNMAWNMTGEQKIALAGITGFTMLGAIFIGAALIGDVANIITGTKKLRYTCEQVNNDDRVDEDKADEETMNTKEFNNQVNRAIRNAVFNEELKDDSKYTVEVLMDGYSQSIKLEFTGREIMSVKSGNGVVKVF